MADIHSSDIMQLYCNTCDYINAADEGTGALQINSWLFNAEVFAL